MSRIREAAERFIGVLKPTISQQASQEESWNAAHKRMEEALGVDLMVHLATGLRLQGDSTASVWESTRKHDIQGYMLTLRWDVLRTIALPRQTSYPDYARGVRIVATPQGEMVEYTEVLVDGEV